MGTFLNTGGGSKLHRTTNGGVSWSVLSLQSSEGFQACHFTSGDSGYVVRSGDSGQILRTTDGGQSWVAPVTPPEPGRLYRIHFANFSLGYVVGERAVYKTSDAGVTWVRVLTNTGTFRPVVAVNAQTAYVAGAGGAVYRTTNGGASWDYRPTGATTTWAGAAFTSPSTGYVVGTAKVLKTTDSGATWDSLSFRNRIPSLTDVRFTGPDTGYISGGGGGSVFRTVDAGRSWVEHVSAAAGGVRALSFPSTEVGYAISLSAIGKYVPPPPVYPAPVLKSPDDGATAQSVTPTLSWSRPYGAVATYFQLATDSNFAAILASDSTTTTDSSRVLGGLVTETRYHWRMRARYAGGTSGWVRRSFTTRAGSLSVATPSSSGGLFVRPREGALFYVLGAPGPVEARILDLNGREVWSLRLAAQAEGAHAMALPTLGPGIHLLDFRADGRTTRLKLVPR